MFDPNLKGLPPEIFGEPDPEAEAGDTREWPEPQPLPSGLPAVPEFDPELLPEAFRGWVMDVAERMQVPADYPAVGAMVAAGSLIGRQITIRPKTGDDWAVVPNLWGVVIGRPSAMKTPALEAALLPVKAFEAEAAERHRGAMSDWEASQVVAKEGAKVSAQEIRRCIKAGQKKEAHAIAQADIDDDRPQPVRRRYIVNDSTVEKLGEILSSNPNGVLIFRDELVGFLRTMDREGHEADRAFYLEAWSGLGRFTFDRIGRGTIDIDAACVSILGGIQPGPLADYLAGAVRGGVADDGLVQRFQLAVWPDVSPIWRDVDRWPNQSAKQAATEALRRLESIDPSVVGAAQYEGELPFLRFDPKAQAIFREWRTDLEARLRSEEDHPAIEAHMAKYRSLVPSLALICHLVDNGAGPVPEAELLRAIGWAEYLEAHARRIYCSVTHQQTDAAHRLAAKLLSGELASPFVLRDVYRPQWAGLPDRQAAQGAVEVLLDCDWLAEEAQATAGRTKMVYRLNPKVKGGTARH